eukprot:TRINITY_DN5400_c2_g1_i1.p1 TRINITY_DN5400_c2_g1~~TRINITY_DN5400_c2_g1_i1.p1  ORF type:complete len:179 (+),score=0.94 TRINITY_DN5400_c2_g1_i1:71-607(+)
MLAWPASCSTESTDRNSRCRLPSRAAEVRAFVASVDKPSDPNSITASRRHGYPGRRHYEHEPGVRPNIGWHGKLCVRPHHPQPHPVGIRIVANPADTGRACGEPTGTDGRRWDKMRSAADCKKHLVIPPERRCRTAGRPPGGGGLRAFPGERCPTFSHCDLLFPAAAAAAPCEEAGGG